MSWRDSYPKEVPTDDEICKDVHARNNFEGLTLHMPNLWVGVILSLVVVIVGIILLW